MKTVWTALAGFAFLLSGAASAAPATNIKLPTDGDAYSALVRRAMAHDETVDFRALRAAYLASAARQRAAQASDTLEKLNAAMLAGTQEPIDAAKVRSNAEQILSLDFTDMHAQKLLRQSCAIQHDDACAELHHFVEFGLLTSITHSGDGKSCATGWEALQVREEYFLLAMLDTTVVRQALISDGGHSCDAMSVKDENGADQTYYFRIDAMMAAEQAAIEGK